MKRNIIVALAAAAIGIVAATLVLRPSSAAPEAHFATLAGERFSTSDLRGKVVLVNFWATSCGSCVKEMPRMVETWRKYSPRGYEMIAVAMSHDHPNQVADFAQRRGLPFKVALDTGGDIARQFGGVRITPTSFLVDRQGRVVQRYRGEPDWAEFHALIERTL